MRPDTRRNHGKSTGKLTLLLALLLAAALIVICILVLSPNDAAPPSAGSSAQHADTAVSEQTSDAGETDAAADEPDAGDVPDVPEDAAPQATAQAEASDGPPLTCYLIDVWQGDSILLVSPEGRTMLIDAGDADHYDAVAGQLSALDITHLDVLIATHPHGDHIGAMGRLVKNISVGACYLTDQVANIYAYTRLLDALEDNSVPTYITDTDTVIPWDSACPVTVLSPVAGVTYTDLNASSIVLRVDYGDTSVLLTGDATCESEKIMLATFPADAFSADVLKLGHHGSSDATGEPFLRAVDPSVVMASLGAENEYGHPHREILSMLRAHGLELLRTDERGTIKIVLDGTAVTVVQ